MSRYRAEFSLIGVAYNVPSLGRPAGRGCCTLSVLAGRVTEPFALVVVLPPTRHTVFEELIAKLINAKNRVADSSNTIFI